MSTRAEHSIRSEIKDTISLSIPLIVSQMVYASSSFIGTAFVARLGEDALAASVLVSMIWMCLSVFFFGLLNSISVLVSHQYGAKNDDALSAIMGQSYILGIIVCVLLVLILLTMPLYLHWSAQPAKVLDLARQYMYSLLWLIPGLLTLIIHEQFLAGIGRTKMVLRISFLVVPIEIPLIYMLIFGKWGLPECGIAGVGYGFAITYTTTAILLTWYLLKAKNYRHFHIFSKINQFHMPYIKELFKIGLPIGFMHVIEVSTFTVMTFWIAQFGTTLLAAHQIVIQYLNFAITLVFAMSQAVSIRVGHAVGREDIMGIRYASYSGLIINFLCVILISAAFTLFPKFFLSLDIDVNAIGNLALIRDASMLLFISAILLLFDNFRIVGFGALRALKDTRFAMFSSLIAFWFVGLSAAFIFGFLLKLAGVGIWWGIVAGIASGAIIIIARLYYLLTHLNHKKLMSITQH